MSAPAIRVRQLGKQFQVGLREDAARTFCDALADTATAPWRRFRQLSGRADERETFWALKEVSFEVPRGEVVGVIGRNGAGKSTLLKVLSRITEPTTGRIDLWGRVASLLEVGTGFHPELTGRENIFLNGAILGMTRAEISRKFDEIVAFAEIERFIDTPVKRYSSGMYVRLAFAVAAHLEPEILVVDEVLAVGDAAFQKKCLGKMGEVARGGRTVLFVSHNLAAITQLCDSALLLENGRLKLQDDAAAVVSAYMLNGCDADSEVDLRKHQLRSGSGVMRFVRARLRNGEDEPTVNFSIGDDLVVEFEIERRQPIQRGCVSVQLLSADGLPISNMVDADSGFEFTHPEPTETVAVRLNDLRLYPGSYVINLWAGTTTATETYDFVEQCLQFRIVDGGKLTHRPLPRHAGLLFLTPEWTRQSTLALAELS